MKPHPISGIVYARGHQPVAAGRSGNAGLSCAEPNCPLVYHGGPVQHSPHLYLLLWGPHWSSNAAQAATANYLENFYAGLGTSVDSWSTITSQYGDGTGFPTFSGSVFVGAFADTSSPPSSIAANDTKAQNDLAAEADAFASSEHITDLTDAQIIIATPPGTCVSGFDDGNCPSPGTYCAWHSYSKETFTNLPYLLDSKNSGRDCGYDAVNSGAAGAHDGFSIVGGHEYAETITDPEPDSGWIDLADAGSTGSGGEDGDKCAWRPPPSAPSDITLSTGSFAVQPTWSNAAYHASGNGCVISSGHAPGISTSVFDAGTNQPWSGTEAGGASAYDTSTVTGTTGGPTPTGTVTYKFFGNGSCKAPAATAEQVTITSGSVPNSSATPALVPGSYSFEASFSSGDANYTSATSSCEPFSVPGATQAPLTITSTTGTAGIPLQLTTTGGSDSGTVSYVVNGPGTAACQVSGSTLSATHAGTCLITGTMAGNATYGAVSSQPTTITFAAAPGRLAVTLSNVHPAPGGAYTLRLTGRALSGGTYGATHNRSEVDVYEEAVSLACAPSRAAEASRVASSTAVKTLTVSVAAGTFSLSQHRTALTGQHQSVRFCGYLSRSPSATDAVSTAFYTTT